MSSDLGVWTSEDSALVLVDYQAELLESIRSETGADLVELLARRLAKTVISPKVTILGFAIAVSVGSAGSALKLAGGPNPQAPAPGWR